MPFTTSGTWGDVLELAGEVVHVVTSQSGQVLAETETRPLWIGDFKEWGLYTRAAASGSGHILAIAQGQATGNCLYTIDGGTPVNLGPCHGEAPVEVIGQPEGWTVYVFRPGRYDIYSVNQFGTHELEGSVPSPSSQGFLQCDGGVVKLADDYRTSAAGLVYPNSDGGFSIGQNAGPDPARLRIRDDASGRLAAVFYGIAQRPRILVQRTQPATIYVASWTDKGSQVIKLRADQIEWGNDEVKPDIPYVPDPNGVIEDVLPFVRAGVTAESNKILWLHKSQETSDWGEWWDYDDQWIGHYEDASTGLRLPDGSLDGYYFDGPRVWLPRRIKSTLEVKYNTTIRWRNGRVETVPITIRVDVGRGRYNGRDVVFRQSYDPRRPDPANSRRKAGILEINYYGPTGWVRHEFYKDNEQGVPQLLGFAQGPQSTPDVFVQPRRPTVTPIAPKVETPKPQPTPVFQPIPRDQLLNVLTWLRTEVYTPLIDGEPRPQPAALVNHPLDDEGIAAWLCDNYIRYRQSGIGHEDAKHRVYRDIKQVVMPDPTPEPSPNPFGRLGVNGRTFTLD